jgi:hypothetical protein
LRTIQSIMSAAISDCTSATAHALSRSIASCRSIRSTTSRRSTRSIVAAYSPPAPVNSVIASPVASRSTRTA